MNLKAQQFLEMATELQKKGFFDIFVDYSQPELRIMDMLHRENNIEISPSTLSEELRISRVNVTNALNSLESQGYIIRSIDPQDRRKVIVTLTELGKTEIQDNIKRVITFLDQMFRTIGVDLTDSFMEIIKVVTEVLPE